MTGVACSGNLGLNHGLLARLNPSSSTQTKLNLSGTRFVHPCGLVAVMCLAESAVMAGRHVEFTGPPAQSDASKYMYRMQLHQRLAELGVHAELTPVRSRDRGDTLLEVLAFNAQEPGESLAERVFRLALDRHGQDAAQRLYTAVMEAVGNVIEHARISPRGYLALQMFPRSNSARFAIGDAGQGVRRSLEGQHSLTSDRDSIERAIVQGVTGTGVAGRGLGLPTLVDLSSLEFDIASGRSHLRRTSRGDQWSATPSGVSVPGTIVAGTVTV